MEKIGVMVAFQDPRVQRYIEDSVGEEGLRLAAILERRGDATDVDLAEELGAKPSHVRKILYALYEARAAEYHKEKDKETGWLTFHWQLTPDQALHAIDVKLKREIGALEAQLREREGRDFYACPHGDERLDFTAASEVDFRCPRHGELLEAVDNRQELESIRHRIAELSQYAESVAGQS